MNEAASLAMLAEQDWEMFVVLKGAPRVGSAGVCFHAQQCIEKYYKALLCVHGQAFDRTHNHSALSALLGGRAGQQPLGIMELSAINPCAVDIRYDGMRIESIDRDWLMEKTSQFRFWAKNALISKGVEI